MLQILSGLLAAGAVGCAVPAGNDPVLEAREAELASARETVTQLKKELDAFKLDRDSMANDLRNDIQNGSNREVASLRSQLAEKDQKIEELKRVAASAPAGDKLLSATVTFTSGRTTSCQVLSFKDGKLSVKLPGGQVTQAGLSNIQSIEWTGAAENGSSGGSN